MKPVNNDQFFVSEKKCRLRYCFDFPQKKATALRLAYTAGHHSAVAALLAYGVDEDATEVKGEDRLKAARAALTRAAKYPGSQLAVYVAHLSNDLPTNELCSLSSFAVVTSFFGNRWVARQGALVVDPDHKNALSHCEALMSIVEDEHAKFQIAALSALLTARQSGDVAAVEKAMQHAAAVDGFPYLTYLEEQRGQLKEPGQKNQQMDTTVRNILA